MFNQLTLILFQDREFVEQDLVEAQLSEQANVINQPQTLSLSKKLKLAAKGGKSTTSSCIRSCCRRRTETRSRDENLPKRKSDSTSDWELNDIESNARQRQQQGHRLQQQPQQRSQPQPQPQRQHQQQQPQQQQQQRTSAPANSHEHTENSPRDLPAPSTSKSVVERDKDKDSHID